jgi:cyclic beta-1,2-glucan synthetase
MEVASLVPDRLVPGFDRIGTSCVTGAIRYAWVIMEWLLGFRLRGAILHLDPCIPRAWRRFEISFRYHASHYEIVVENPQGVTRGVTTMEVDGRPVDSAGGTLHLSDDGATRHVRVVLGPRMGG